ncbi:MAG: hypothetical protein WCG03_04055 [Kiritimatiellales bacterium]
MKKEQRIEKDFSQTTKWKTASRTRREDSTGWKTEPQQAPGEDDAEAAVRDRG